MKQRHDMENPEGILSWDNALCEACWIGEESQWDFDDEEHEVLVSVKSPEELVKGAPLEACSSCGAPTIIGLYVHRDPDLVNFPRYERDPQEEDKVEAPSH